MSSFCNLLTDRASSSSCPFPRETKRGKGWGQETWLRYPRAEFVGFHDSGHAASREKEHHGLENLSGFFGHCCQLFLMVDPCLLLSDRNISATSVSWRSLILIPAL